jgi:hypothetical protein
VDLTAHNGFRDRAENLGPRRSSIHRQRSATVLLPTAVRPDQCHALSGSDGQAQVGQRDEPAVAAAERTDLERCALAGSHPRRRVDVEQPRGMTRDRGQGDSEADEHGDSFSVFGGAGHVRSRGSAHLTAMRDRAAGIRQQKRNGHGQRQVRASTHQPLDQTERGRPQ